MKIYTKTGDSGSTSLVGGERVCKNHPRVEAYGDVDELISILGSLRCEAPSHSDDIRRIQINLMNVSACLATSGDCGKIKDLNPSELSFLENRIDCMTAELPPQTAFVLPGEPRSSSLCHTARCVCRRSERRAVAIEEKNTQDEAAIQYLNRLSDYLFTLARYLCMEGEEKDDFWLP